MSALRRIVLATGNAHKVEEVMRILGAFAGWEIPVESARAVGGMPEVEENGATFAANAEIKARALLSQIEGGDAVLADDSGLEVDALNGAPGIYSARYAGIEATDTDNRQKLIQALQSVESNKRQGRFVCSLCLIDGGGTAQVFEGRCEGVLVDKERGVEGFGYDPLFIPEGYNRTFAELGPAVKDRISHRAQALQHLAQTLLRDT